GAYPCGLASVRVSTSNATVRQAPRAPLNFLMFLLDVVGGRAHKPLHDNARQRMRKTVFHSAARRTPCGACSGTATPLYSPAEGVHDAVSQRQPGTDYPT